MRRRQLTYIKRGSLGRAKLGRWTPGTPLVPFDPLAIVDSNFEAGRFGLNGVAYTYNDFWHHGDELTASEATLEPGIGWQWYNPAEEAGSDQLTYAQDLVNDAVIGANGAYIVVVDHTIETSPDEPTRRVSYMSVYGHNADFSKLQAASQFMDHITGPDGPYLSNTRGNAYEYVENNVRYRLGVAFHGDGNESLAYNGITPVNNAGANSFWGADIDRIYMSAGAEPSGAGWRRVIIHRIRFYPISMLSQLESLTAVG